MPFPRFSQRQVAALVAVGSIALATGLLVSEPARAAGGLAAAARIGGRYFGSATDNPELGDPGYVAALTGGEFSATTPANSMKWETIEPTENTFDYTDGDAVVSLAKAHGMQVRGHTLVWHNQLAAWVQHLPRSRVRAAMENHITNVVSHYKGRLYAWDVVNQPFNEDGSWRTNTFYAAMGQDYVADALRAARAADPGAKLYLNDYNIEGVGAKADAMYALVKSLRAAGVPIDGVGFETHLALQYGFPHRMQQNLQRFAGLGVDVAITELDVRMRAPETAAKDASQITYYTDVVKACLAVPGCVGITIWDYTDQYSWVPAAFPGEGSALPWDGKLTKKTALYSAIISALAVPVTRRATP